MLTIQCRLFIGNETGSDPDVFRLMYHGPMSLDGCHIPHLCLLYRPKVCLKITYVALMI